MLKNLKISQKLLGTAAIISLIVAFVGYLGIANADKAKKDQQELIKRAQPIVDLLEVQKMYQVNIVMNASRVLEQTQTWDNALQNVKDAQEELEKARKNVSAQMLSDQKPESKSTSGFEVGKDKSARELYKEIEGQYEQADKNVTDLLAILSNPGGDSQEKLQRFVKTQMYPALDPITEKLQTVIEQQTQATIDPKAAAAMAAANDRTISTLWLLLVVAVVVAVLMMVFLARSIRKPLNELVEVATAVAREGDIRRQVGYESKDEIGQVADAFRDLSAFLNQQASAITEISKGDVSRQLKVRSDYDVLGQATKQAQVAIGTLVGEASNLALAAGTGDLTGRMDDADLEGAWKEIAGGMNMAMDSIQAIFTDTGQNLEKLADKDLTARITNEYPGDYGVLKDDFNTALSAFESGFSQVKQGSESIANVSFVLKMSSDALANSASLQSYSVEAIQGSLAEISGAAGHTAMNAAIGVAAVQEAKQFVDTSLVLVEEGEVFDLLTAIQDKVTLVEGYVNEIAADAAKQSEGIDVVNSSLEQIKQVGDDVANNADEAAKAVSALSEQADTLNDLAGSYKLGGADAAVATMPAPSAPAPAEQGAAYAEAAAAKDPAVDDDEPATD